MNLEILLACAEVIHRTGRANENHGDQCKGNSTVARFRNIIQIGIISRLADRLFCTTCALAGSGIVVMISLLCDRYAALLADHLMGLTILVVNQLLSALMVTSLGLDCATGTDTIFIKYMCKLFSNHDAAISAGCLVGLSVSIVFNILESMLADGGILLVAARIALTVAIAVQTGDTLDSQTAVAGQVMGTIAVGMGYVIVLMAAFRLGVHNIATGIAVVVTIAVSVVHGHTNQLAAGALILVLGFTDGNKLVLRAGVRRLLVLISALIADSIIVAICTFAAEGETIHMPALRALHVMHTRRGGNVADVMFTYVFFSHGRHWDNTDQHCQCHQHCQKFLVHYFFFTSLYSKDF